MLDFLGYYNCYCYLDFLIALFYFILFLDPHVSTDVMALRCYFLYLVLRWNTEHKAKILQCYGYYLLIFSSGMGYRALFQICGRLYLPMFLFMVGLFTLMYMAS